LKYVRHAAVSGLLSGRTLMPMSGGVSNTTSVDTLRLGWCVAIPRQWDVENAARLAADDFSPASWS
jgi:hypothetical protein